MAYRNFTMDVLYFFMQGEWYFSEKNMMRGLMRIVAKRRMAVWCAVLAAVFFAAGLFAFCYPLKARAEEVTPASFISAAEGVTVTAGQTNTGATEGDGYDVTGLTVEGGAGYSASLKGVFKEDVKLDFALLSKIATDTTPANFGGQGAFSFRVTDAGDPTSYFDIILQPVNFWGVWHNVAYVRYGNEIRWRQHGANGGGGIFNTDVVSDASNSLYAWAAIPMNGADGITENSYIKLSWTGDDKAILNVSVMCGHNYNTEGQRYEIVLASFDGTEALNSDAKEFGLKKLTGMKENGFTIAFGSDYADEAAPENNGTDICLTQLTVGGTEYDLRAARRLIRRRSGIPIISRAQPSRLRTSPLPTGTEISAHTPCPKRHIRPSATAFRSRLQA